MSAAGDRQNVRRLEGSRILVVEDESIISLMIEDMLIHLGCATVWQASRVEAALTLLDNERPDAALLDINLAGEPAYPIAERLEGVRIPFVFATGYYSAQSLLAIFEPLPELIQLFLFERAASRLCHARNLY